MEGFISLTFFTVLGQTAAGMAILSAVFEPRSDQQRYPLWVLVSLALMVLGGIASVTHLGYFLHSLYTLTNPFSSPLSQEIYSVGIFGGLLFLSLFIRGLWLRILLALSGVLMVYVMSNVYTIENVAPWNSSITLASFFTTAILIGAVFLFAVDTFKNKGNKDEILASLTGWKTIVIALAFVARIVLVPLQVIRASTPVNTTLLDSQLTLTGVAVVLGFFLIFRNALRELNQKETCSVPLFTRMVILCLILLAGELCGRFLFFSHYVNFGM